MQPNDTLPVIPYPAFLVGRYAAQAMEILREAEAETGMKPVEEAVQTEAVNPPDLPPTAFVETSRATEAAILSNLNDPTREDEAKAFLTSERQALDASEGEERQLDLYT